MQRIQRLMILTAIGVFAASPLGAQQTHIADELLLDRLVSAKVAETHEQRLVIERLLERREVREIAGRAGIELKSVTAAVATLDGEALAQLAAQAQGVEDSLAGGQSRVTISTTATIIGLLLLILIIVAN